MQWINVFATLPFFSQFSLIDNFILVWGRNGDGLGWGFWCLPVCALSWLIKRQPRICHPSKLNHTFYYLRHSRWHQICQSTNNKSADEAPKRLNTRKNCSWWVCRDKICSILCECDCECVWQSRKLSMNKWNNAHFGLMFGFNFDVWRMIAFCCDIYTDLRLSKAPYSLALSWIFGCINKSWHN